MPRLEKAVLRFRIAWANMLAHAAHLLNDMRDGRVLRQAQDLEQWHGVMHAGRVQNRSPTSALR